MRHSSIQPADGIFTPGRRALSLGILASVSVVAFESLAVATILPSAARDLDGFALYGWAFSAFLLASLVGAATAGELADRHGSASPALLGFGAFGVGLLVAGLAPSWLVLLVGRALQGFGGGTLLSLAYAAVPRGYPPRLQSATLALLSSAWVVPAFVGPLIAGQIAEQLSWRGVFLGLVPIVLGAALILARAATQLPMRGVNSGVSRVSASVRLAIGTGSMLWGAGQTAGLWTLAFVVAGGVLAFPALVDLLPSGTFTIRPGLPAGTIVRFLLAFGFFGVEALIPLGLTTQRQLTPSMVGVALSLAALSWVGASWLQARADARDAGAGRGWRVRFGLALLMTGILGACGAIIWSPWPAATTALAWAVSGLGIGIAYPASTVLALNAVDPAHSGDAAASLEIAETLGTAVGTGVIIGLFAATMRFDWAGNASLAVPFVAATAVIVLALIPASRGLARQLLHSSS
jgi:MFS family permease